MAVAVRPVRRPLTAVPAPIDRAGLAAWPLLAALISLNVVVRTALGWLRETPIYLGDEYLYAELGRSHRGDGQAARARSGVRLPGPPPAHRHCARVALR